MKILFLILILMLISSCSSTSNKKAQEIDDVAWDSMSKESYYRWGEKRLSTLSTQDNLVVGCYQGRIKETLKAYKDQYSTREKNPYYWLHIGNCYYLNKDYNKANFYYKLSLDDAKDNNIKSLTYNNMATIDLKFEKWDKARDHLKKSSSLNNHFKIPIFNLAQLYLQFGQHDRAIALLTQPIWNDVKDPDLYFSLANAYLFKGENDAAEKYLKLLPKNYLKREDIAITYSLYLIRKGEIQKAKRVMNKREISSTKEVGQISKKVEILIEGRSIR